MVWRALVWRVLAWRVLTLRVLALRALAWKEPGRADFQRRLCLRRRTPGVR